MLNLANRWIPRTGAWAIGCLCLLGALVTAHAKAPPTKPTVAVLYFEYSGTDKEMAALQKGLASMLITDLTRTDGIQVVERARLEAVLKELKLNRSARVKKKHAVKIGKILGAQYIIVGHYIYVMKKLVLEARLLNTATTAYTKVAARATGTAEDFLTVQSELSQKLRAGLEAALPSLRTAVKTAAKTKKRRRKSKKRTTQRPKVHLKTAIRYAKALDAKDKGNMQVARRELQRVVKKAPHFLLAKKELDRLLQ